MTFLHEHKDVCNLHFLLPARGIVTSIAEPPSLLLNPLKYSRPTLLPSICHHRLGGKEQLKVGGNDYTKAIKRDERKPMAAQQLLLK